MLDDPGCIATGGLVMIGKMTDAIIGSRTGMSSALKQELRAHFSVHILES
jgi:hypothetical protein